MSLSDPAIQFVDLINKCPSCGNSLFSYYHNPSCDNPGIGTWYVECSKACGYEYDDSFPDLEWLNKEFTIINKTDQMATATKEFRKDNSNYNIIVTISETPIIEGAQIPVYTRVEITKDEKPFGVIDYREKFTPDNVQELFSKVEENTVQFKTIG